MASVYLAGPITGLSYKGATEWRLGVKEELKRAGIRAYDPMRAKQYLSDVKNFSPTCEGYDKFGCMSSNKGITTRDRWDATRCSVLLVNFIGAERISVGTVMEIAWADLRRTPIVIAMEKGNIHEHGMIEEAVGFRTGSLEEAVQVVKSICLD